ncbi:MAG: hypothetical protein ACOCP3_02070, partial [Halodesulfurarchaeum sp.]
YEQQFGEIKLTQAQPAPGGARVLYATQGATDREALVGFLSDLRTDEAATIERIRNREGQ